MITVNIREEDEFIKLGQALKKASLVGSGVDAKMVIQDGHSCSPRYGSCWQSAGR